MKCQNLFSGNKKNISVCKLLKILPKVLSINYHILKENKLGALSEPVYQHSLLKAFSMLFPFHKTDKSLFCKQLAQTLTRHHTHELI